MRPPKPKKIRKVLSLHGDQRMDPYYWMKNRGRKDVLSHIKKESLYFNHQIKPAVGLQKKIFKEIKKRIPPKEDSVPYRSGNYLYFFYYKKNKEYPVYCRKNLKGKRAQTLLDVNQLAQGYYDLSSMAFSKSHRFLAFCVDQTGRRIYTIHFKDLKTNQILDHKISETDCDIVWADDDCTLFYTVQDPKTLRTHKIFKYNLQTRQSQLVFEEKDPAFSVSVYKTLSKKFVFIQSLSTLTAECRFIKADQPSDRFKIFKKRKRGHKYHVLDGGDVFYILTNSRDCVNYRLDQAGLRSTASWKNIIPHSQKIYLEDFEVFEKWIALEVRVHGLTQILLMDRKTKKIQFIPLGKKPAHFTELGDNGWYGADRVRFEYESLTAPHSVYDYNPSTGKKILLKRQNIVGKFSPSAYQSLSLTVFTRDGQKAPLSLLYKKSLFKKGKNPLFLYGYGAYGHSTEPGFYPHIFSLVDRGFVFAMAHVRGGAEKGYHWYETGRALNKKNTFYDFIDCSKYLIRQGYVHPQKLYACGGSAGGLMMGSVLNMSPHLYKGIVAQVPFVDALTTMLDKDIPLTTGEYDEWGNPNKKKYYHYIKSYSPYDNVRPGFFPYVLVISGYHDSQVQYWEPLKWVAKLRDCQKAKDRSILLYMDMGSGHSGQTGRFERLRLLAMEYAFLLHCEGIKK